MGSDNVPSQKFSIKKLGDILTLQRGFDLPSAKRIYGSIPIVSSSGITGFHCEAKISSPGIVTGRYGTIGEVFFIKDDFWPLNTTLFVKDFKGNEPKYLAYLLETLNIKELNTAGAVPGVNRNHLHQIKVKVPPLPTQQKIARILSAYDDLIENNLKRIKLLEEMAQLTYEEWFVRMKFPEHEQAVIDSETGLPEGWRVSKLLEEVELIKDSILPINIDATTKYIGLEHIPRKSITLSEHGVASDVSSLKTVVKKGDILFGKIRPYFHKVGIALTDCISSTDAIVVRANNKMEGIILQVMFSESFVSAATQSSNGTKMPRANWNVLKNYEFIIPTDLILHKYNDLSGAMVSSISNLVIQNQHLKEARDILLPRLMTGMIDVDSLALADPVVNKARPTESAYNSEASINPSVPTQSITAM